MNNRLAKREIRHIAENVFQEFHSSAHGMHVTDVVRALQTLIDGDNARLIGCTGTLFVLVFISIQ